MMGNDRSIPPTPHELAMIVDRELDVGRDPRPVFTEQIALRPSRIVNGGVLLLLFVSVLILQSLTGAYHSEFNGYPDESAHYVTSLMVRQYIVSPQPGLPVPFAQDYYAHYPKVAFGHWPPLFYVVQGLWMFLFSPARASVLLELAVTTTFLAYSVYVECRRWLADVGGSLRTTASVCAALLTISIPLIQTYTAEEMSETLLALLCFWSAIYFARYVQSERWQDNCLFGCLFALAVLTKGSGWLLALLPPLTLLLTRKLRLLLRLSFWIAPIIVAATCIPWQLMTMHLVEEGWAGGSRPSVEYTLDALPGFGVLLLQLVGPALLLLAALGIFITVLRPMIKRPVAAEPAAMFALIIADWLLHSIVPAGVEDRKLIMAIPALVLFAVAGAFWLASRLPLPVVWHKWRLPLVAAVAGVFFCTLTFAIPHERHYGFIEAARYIASDPVLRKATVLVSSESGGEGPFIAEVAMREPHPNGVILRGTKVLAHVSFDADVYRAIFPDASSVLKYLYQRHVDFLVLDTFPHTLKFPHNEFLRQLVREPARFQLVSVFPDSPSSPSGEVQLFRIRYPQ